jgi:predicted neutral ceramidase superfamily lipid hydrolase
VKNKLVYVIPRMAAVGLVTFWVIYVFWAHGFTMAALIESSIWLVVLGATMIAWGNEVMGAVIFIILGLLYYLTSFNRMGLNTLLFVSGPLILTGVLFITDRYFAKKKRKKR